MAMTVPSGGPAREAGVAGRWRPQRRTALHDCQVALGAAFLEVAGWQVASAFRPLEEELAAVRAGVGLVDLSSFGKLRLVGREVARLLADHLGGGAVPSVGRTIPIQAGGRPDDRLLLGLTADEFLLTTAPGAEEGLKAELEARLAADGACAHLFDVTSSLAAIAVVGPASREVLRRITPLDLRPWRFPDGSCAQGSVAKVPGLVVRSDRGGLPAYRLFVSWAYGGYLWETLWDAGRDLGVAPMSALGGWAALGG